MPEIVEFKNAASTASLIVSDGKGLYLIKRKHNPFKDMWALPGGFLNCDQESLEEAAIRELKEETTLETYTGALVPICTNSEPDRDPRGHVIDHVYMVMEYTGKPEASDDAKEIKYFDLSDLPELAFDHKKSIIKFKRILSYSGPLERILSYSGPLAGELSKNRLSV
jgi:8-oxo-dGTP diphosphatase